MAETPKNQPSTVSTADTPERPQNVFTEEPAVAAAQEASTAAPGEKPGQTSDDSATPPNKSKRKPHRDRPAERRISKLTRQLDASEATNAELLGRIEKLEAGQAAKPPAPEPQLKDFKTPKEYAHALNAWEAEQKPAAKPKSTDKPAKPKPSANTAHAEDLKTFANEGKERIGEKFQAAFTDNDLAINQVMGEFLLDSDVGPEVMVYLHEHQDEARQIWFDKPEEANKRLEAIESKLDGNEPPPGDTNDDGKPARNPDGTFATKAPDPEPKRKATTKSSAPPAPSDSERGETIPDTNLEKAPMDDYAAQRRKQIRAAGGRA